MGSETLRFIIKAKDEASGALRSAGGGFGKLGLLAKAGIAIALAALIALTTAVIHFADQYEEAFDSIRIATGATGEKLAGLEDDFNAVVKRVPTDFASASTAISTLNQRLGVTGKPLQALAADFLRLHTILGIDVKTSIAETTRLFGDWSIKSIPAQRNALNLLFRTTQQTGIGWDDLTQTVVQFGAPLRNLGFTFGESIAMLGKWEKEGVNVSTVLTGMRFALKTFGAAGIDPRKGLAKAFEDIKTLPKMKALDVGKNIFGLRAFSDVVAAIREGRFQYQDLIKSVANGKDTIAKAERATRNWHDNLTLLKNNALVALEPVLTKVSGALADWTGGLVKAARSDGAKSMFSKIGDGVGWVRDKIAAAVRVIGPILGPVFSDWVKTTRIYMRRIMPVVSAVFRAVVQVVKWAWPVVKDIIIGALNVIAGIMRAVMAVMRGDWSGAWRAIQQIVRGAGRVVSAVIRSLASSARAILSAAWNALKSLTAAAWSAMVSAVRSRISQIVSTVRALPGQIVSAIGSLGSLLYNAGASLIQGLISGITDKLSALWSTVSSIAGKIRDLKGPLDYDRVLLRPAGQAIIGGLMAGIDDQLGPLYRQVSGIAGGIGVNVGAPSLGQSPQPIGSRAQAAGAPRIVELTVNGNVYGVDDLLGLVADGLNMMEASASRGTA